MDLVIATGVLIGGCAAGAFLLVFRSLTRHQRFSDVNPEWLSAFTIGKYRPMARLLAEEDFEFLASQKGYEPRIARVLRSERRKIFREYLRCLWRDFGRLETAVRLLIVNSPEDRTELAVALLRQRLVFTRAIATAEFRLVLHGVGLGNVDIRGLLGSVDAMHARVGQLALARQTSPA